LHYFSLLHIVVFFFVLKYNFFHVDVTPMLLFVEGSCTTPFHSLLQELGVIRS
jgi:hypothetical protein